ncbi:hypothetical protein [Salinicoccus sp. CNSTN-B1]
MNNGNIRKALDMSYDKAEAADSILKNGSIPAYFLVPENFVENSEGEDFREKYGDFNMTDVEEAQKSGKRLGGIGERFGHFWSY